MAINGLGIMYKGPAEKGPDVERPHVKWPHVKRPYVKRPHLIKAPSCFLHFIGGATRVGKNTGSAVF